MAPVPLSARGQAREGTRPSGRGHKHLGFRARGTRGGNPQFFPCPARTDACVCVRPSGLGRPPLPGRERVGAGRNKEPVAFPGGGVALRASLAYWGGGFGEQAHGGGGFFAATDVARFSIKEGGWGLGVWGRGQRGFLSPPLPPIPQALLLALSAQQKKARPPGEPGAGPMLVMRRERMLSQHSTGWTVTTFGGPAWDCATCAVPWPPTASPCRGSCRGPGRSRCTSWFPAGGAPAGYRRAGW